MGSGTRAGPDLHGRVQQGVTRGSTTGLPIERSVLRGGRSTDSQVLTRQGRTQEVHGHSRYADEACASPAPPYSRITKQPVASPIVTVIRNFVPPEVGTKIVPL
jgi:hypothetical protein